MAGAFSTAFDSGFDIDTESALAIDTQVVAKKVRDIMYGYGIGEKPTMRRGTGTVTVSGTIASFSLVSGEGAKVQPGMILDAFDPANSGASYSFYILTVSSDAITAINGYDGTAIANAATTPTVFQVNPHISGANIFQSIGTVIDKYLWPEVWEVANASIASPNLVDGQNDGEGDEEEILAAWQKIGPTYYPVPSSVAKHMGGTSDFSSGKMVTFDVTQGTTLYYTYKRRVTSASTTSTDALVTLIATGSAAHALGGTQVEVYRQSSSKDAQERVSRRNVSDLIWRDFLTQRRSFMEDLSKDVVTHFEIVRG